MCAQVGGSLALCCAVLCCVGLARLHGRGSGWRCGSGAVVPGGPARIPWTGRAAQKYPRPHLLTSLASGSCPCVQMYYRGTIFRRALSSVWSRLLHARTARARCPATRPAAPAWPGVPAAAARALPLAATAAEHAPHFVAAGKMFGLCVQAMFFLRFSWLTEIARWLCLHAPPHACSSCGCAAGPCACTA